MERWGKERESPQNTDTDTPGVVAFAASAKMRLLLLRDLALGLLDQWDWEGEPAAKRRVK